MDVSEQIKRFEEFIDRFYKPQLLDQVIKGHNHLVVDFAKMTRFDPELAELILDQPEELLKAFEIAIKNIDLPGDVKKFYVRLKNLPRSQNMEIRDVRSKHIEKLLTIEGIVRQKSDVRPQVTTAKFECPSCGNIIPVIQLESKFKEPSRCGCGRKGKFRMIQKDLVDAQKIVLEEIPERMEGGQPKRIDVFLKNDLVSPLSDKKTNPGTKISVVGYVKEVPIPSRDGGKLVRFDLMVDANYVESIDDDYAEILIEEEEKKQIEELAKNPKILKMLAQSMAPSIYGHDQIKEAIILQLLGGVLKKRSDGAKSRGDIHILLVGDPGSGKSQLLKRAQLVAPKSRYVSGKGASGAGLTAAVVKDEFLRGWALEAGALVLANKGFCMIDEMDKMSKEDTSAMHEALEQQCFHKDTIITLADGSETKISDFVESFFSRYPDRVTEGKDCFVIDIDDLDERILSTDWYKIFPVNITKVSKHRPFDCFYKIKIGNGRDIQVTPDHPVFCIEDGKIVTKPAKDLTGDEWVPIPLKMPISGEMQSFDLYHSDVYNTRASNHISIPVHNDPDFYRVLGYLLSEGSKETNRGKFIGINFTNKDARVLTDFEGSMFRLFNIQPYKQWRIDNHDPRLMIRYISTEIANFFSAIAPEILKLSGEKQIPQIAMKGELHEIRHMLSAMFEGDGHVAKKARTIRVGFASNSKRMCEQVQDLLLRYRIRSNLTEHKLSFKVSITGYNNIRRFHEHIGFVTDKKNKIIQEYLMSKTPSRTIKNIIPNVTESVIDLMQKHKMKIVDKRRIADMKHDYRKRKQSISRSLLKKIVKKLLAKDPHCSQTRFLEGLAFGDIGFERIRNIEKVPNLSNDWVYDVTIEPNHAFISQNMVLHNTVTISKANIQANLRCETTVLAAANPKWGRFDPYEIIGKQIDMPPALISRFDLIFPVRDIPNKDTDEKLASFLLNLHQTSEVGKVPVDTDLLRKYISYARRIAHPVLTDGALEEIKEYYIKMRNAGGEEGGVRSVPITARQLEALVRLAEASAKSRFSEKVLRKDSKKAIELLHFCMSQVGIDPDTGKIDMDVISTGVSSSARNNIIIVKEAINELENKLGKTIPIDELVKEVEDKGVDPAKAEEIVEQLKRAGDIFEPKRGFIQKI